MSPGPCSQFIHKLFRHYDIHSHNTRKTTNLFTGKIKLESLSMAFVIKVQLFLIPNFYHVLHFSVFSILALLINLLL